MPLVSEIQRILSSISSNSENGQLITDEVYTMALKICFTDKSVHLFTAQRSWAYMKSEPTGRVPPPPPIFINVENSLLQIHTAVLFANTCLQHLPRLVFCFYFSRPDSETETVSHEMT